MKELLKDCPFCQSNKFEFNPVFPRDGRGVVVTCKSCRADGPICDTQQEAITAWNTRKETERLRELLEEAYRYLFRYRYETPLGQQPHMIALKVEKLIDRIKQGGE